MSIYIVSSPKPTSLLMDPILRATYGLSMKIKLMAYSQKMTCSNETTISHTGDDSVGNETLVMKESQVTPKPLFFFFFFKLFIYLFFFYNIGNFNKEESFECAFNE